MSIKQGVMGHVPPLDKSTMTETPNFHEFNINVETREQLIHSVKSLAARVGFRAILPFSDRCNRTTAITYFCCSMSGSSARKASTNCPFKLTYMKTYLEPVYKLQADYTSYHNHKLPLEEMIVDPPKTPVKAEPRPPSVVVSEQEKILSRIMSTRIEEKRDKKRKKKHKKKSKSKQHDQVSTEDLMSSGEEITGQN
jgi:hypothetical protein